MRILAVLMLLLMPAAALAAPGDSARSEEIRPAHLTVGGVVVGEFTLKDAMELYGPAKVYQFGPDSAASFRICYTSLDKEFPAKVVFEAGPQSKRSEITAVKIISGQVKFKGADKCSPSARVTEDSGTQSGLKLGMDRRALISLLGMPTEQSKGKAEYEYHARKRLSRQEVRELARTWPYVRKYPYFDVYSSVAARFHEGMVVRLVITRIETR